MSKGLTDERLDGFEERVDRRFDEIDRRFEFIEGRLERIETSVSSLGRVMMVQTGVMAAGFLGIASGIVASA